MVDRLHQRTATYFPTLPHNVARSQWKSQESGLNGRTPAGPPGATRGRASRRVGPGTLGPARGVLVGGQRRCPRYSGESHPRRRVTSELSSLAVLTVLAVLVLLSGGCGAPTPTSAPSTHPVSSSTTPGTAPIAAPSTSAPLLVVQCGVVPSPEITVVSALAPCGIDARTGAHVQVELDSGLRWSGPVSDSAAVEIEDVSTSGNGALGAEIVANHVGHAVVSASGRPVCRSGQPCPQFVRVWRVDITVVAPSIVAR